MASPLARVLDHVSIRVDRYQRETRLLMLSFPCKLLGVAIGHTTATPCVVSTSSAPLHFALVVCLPILVGMFTTRDQTLSWLRMGGD